MDTNESDRALAKKVWLGIIHGEAHLDADTVVNEAAETITANLAAERADNAQELLETATKMAEYETAMMHYQEESARLTAETERLLGLLTRSLSYHEHGIPERPNHQCGTPDAVCDCECCNYADYEAFIVDARAALAGDAHKEADHD